MITWQWRLWTGTLIQSTLCKSICSWSTLCLVMTQLRPRSRAYYNTMMVERHSTALSCTMKEWESVPLITGKQMKLSRTCFLQVNSLCTGCGRRNLRSDSPVLSSNAYVEHEGCVFHSDSLKIGMLLNKIMADFLTPTKAQLEIELSTRTPMTITYFQSLALFCNVLVNQKHPPQMGAAQNRVRRTVDEISTGGEEALPEADVGRGGSGTPRQTRTDSCMITLTDSAQIECHVSFNCPQHVHMKIMQEDK
jgi:hypothetical protein